MTMRKSFLWLFVFIGVAIIVVAWLALRYMPPKVPENLDIPGIISYEETGRTNREVSINAKVSYLGAEYDANLTLKLDSNGQIVLPAEDEVFTTVVAEEESLELWRDTEKIGRLPIVFIANRNDASIYRVAPPGTSLRPISVRPGIQNLAVFHFDTEIQGMEGVTVKLFRDGKQFDSGKLPMITRLAGKEGVAKIDGVQIKGIGGTGVFSVFYDEHKLRVGTNKILPSARLLGYACWHESGTFLGMSDVCYILQGDKVTILGAQRAESELANVDIKGVVGDPVTKDGRLIIKTDGKYVLVSKDGKVDSINFSSDIPVSVSGNLIIADKRVYDLESRKEFLPNQKYWWVADGVFISQVGKDLIGISVGAEGMHEIWRLRLSKPLSTDAKLMRALNGIYYFRMGNSCSDYLDVSTGKCGKSVSLLGMKALDIFEGEDLSFPNGNKIKQNIVCTDEQGKPLWARIGTKPASFGATGVVVWDEKAQSTIIYDVTNGNEIASWKGTGILPKMLAESHFAATINKNHVIFIQRTIKY